MTTDPIATARALIEPLTGYTPGQWDASGLTVYDTCMDGVVSCHADADARLIAAAPALRDMVATLADALEAEQAEVVSLQERIEALEAEVVRLRAENAAARLCLDFMADGDHEAAGMAKLVISAMDLAALRSAEARAEAAEAALTAAAGGA